MKKHLCNRILCLVLAAVMVLGLLPTVSAVPADLRWKESDVEISWDKSDRLVQDELQGMTAHKPTDMVRVSIVLEDVPTLKAGYSTHGIGTNADARAHDLQLQRVQEKMADTISVQALGGDELDVVWNLTLVSNIISAYIPYGKLEAVKAVDGVVDVVPERQYEMTQVETNTYTSAGMVGATTVWQTGLTGAGSRVAIIDTGTDTDHQSFDNGAYLHALEQNAAREGMTAQAYRESLNLLDPQQISTVMKHLNAAERVPVDADEFYISEKLPFGVNYVDKSLDITHDNDTQGSHGSHVAGIAAANRYIPQDGGFVDARESVRMSGVAPDAQIITLKVFGKNPGPFDSDYFAAIEDAIWLGCDSVNLSLGSGSPGFAQNHLFEDLLDYMTTTDTVVVVSSGNSGYWAEYTAPANLYADGVSFQTNGSPGSYANSFTVASVENSGTVGKYIQVGQDKLVYTETDFRNRPMASLDTSGNGTGTEYDYIYVDGFGWPEDYEGINLNGKIVFCQRGEISFSDKGNYAADLGAAAIVVCNNEGGFLNMDLTDYTETAPCVSILQSDSEAVKAASAAHTTSGGLTYYSGKVTVYSEMGVIDYNPDYYTMSAFSSWGVPGSLEMKPEITAPGGMIWSVNGVDTSGTGYEMMSGTSMAAPQVTGMVALVAEDIRNDGLEQKTDLSVRHLAQSLLMSTAEPLRDGESGGSYYSILNQGAGLARVDLATTAESYVLVDGMPDGKVKVELGDDPQRDGTYRFTFDIVNLNGEALSYTLKADVFTQDLFRDDQDNLYLDTQTRDLAAETEFSVDGVSIESMGSFACDLNGDGSTDTRDADYLLEYLLGNVSELHAEADVNGDGKVNTYDAHVLLTKQTGTFTVDVPAGGSASVEVCLKLTEQTKTYLDENYPTGAYLEAFVYAVPISDSEGEQHVTHSIPVLGYYGSWSESSMYDVGSYLEYTYDAETRASYLYQINREQSNFVSILTGGNEYVFGGNPLILEDEYRPERNAFNNENGNRLSKLYFTQVRNAGNSMLMVTDAETGEVYRSEELGMIEAAYYHINMGQWQNTRNRLDLDLDLADYQEGTKLNISLVTAPEYYCTFETDGDGNVLIDTDWDALAGGAYLTTPVTIDNTAPVIKNVVLDAENNVLNITAQDGEYVAAVALMNASGTNVITAAPANQTERGIEMTVGLDLHYVFGEKFLVAVYDYAENVAVYEMELLLNNERPYFTAIDRSHANDDRSINYVGMDSDGITVNLAPASGREMPRAVEYVEGAVFEITDDNSLYVGFDNDLFGMSYLCHLDPEGRYQITGFNDIAYNRADGRLYGLFYSELNGKETPYLTTIDLYAGTLNVLGAMPIDANTIAIDDDGHFYSGIYADSKLYTYTSDVVETGEVTLIGDLMGEFEGNMNYFGTSALNSMAWDHNTGELYWGCTDATFNSTMLLKVDTETAGLTIVHRFNFVAAGLYIAYEPSQDLFPPTDLITSVTLIPEATTLVGNEISLTAQIAPWNASDKSVIWTSSDESVATVDENGVVFGASEGTAVITATSVLDSTKSASCTVTVDVLNQTLKGLVWDEEAQVHWASFCTNTLPAYESLNVVDPTLPVNATMMANGVLYASTLDTSTMLSDLYTVNPETFEMTYAGGSPIIGYLDMAFSPSSGCGFAVYQNYVVPIDLSTGNYLGVFDWTEGMTADLVGITYYGSQHIEDMNIDADFFLLLDADGNVYMEAFVLANDASGYFYGPQFGYLRNIGAPVDYNYFQGFHFDGQFTYWTRFNEADDRVELIAWDTEGTDNVYSMGYFPDGVWPVAGLYTDEQLQGHNVRKDAELSAASFKSVELMDQVDIVKPFGEVKGSLNAVSDAVRPMSSSETTAQGDVSTVITMPDEGTNGRFSVIYDASKLELTGVTGKTDAFAWRQTAEGEIEIAFADRNVLAADAAHAVLRFKALERGGSTNVSVQYVEFGTENIELAEEIAVKLPAAFDDVYEDTFYYEPVLWAVKNGITTGVDETRFNPSGELQRAQFVTFLWRAAGEPAPTTNVNPFTDVEEDDFYYDAVLWAVEEGITKGISETAFGPHVVTNRAQAVTFLWRYLGKPDSVGSNGFTDVEAGQWYEEPINWAVDKGVTNGMSETIFGIKTNCNRAHAVTFLYRALAK